MRLQRYKDMTQNDKSEKIKIYVDSEIADIVPGFLDNREKDIKSIQDALLKEDYEIIQILGHSMKGSGAGYGFDAISDIGCVLEQEAENRNIEGIRRGIEELSIYLERIDVVYK